MKTLSAFLIISLLAVTSMTYAVNPAPSDISIQIKKFTSFPKTLLNRSLSGEATVYFTINSDNKIEVLNVVGKDAKVNLHTTQHMQGKEIAVSDNFKNVEYFVKIRYELIQQ